MYLVNMDMGVEYLVESPSPTDSSLQIQNSFPICENDVVPILMGVIFCSIA